ncbi:MAG: hypothetical protein FJ303_26015 [Planctomycetes bacterium]|nr:hypothetical protein [Planctomycetota bacterium]
MMRSRKPRLRLLRQRPPNRCRPRDRLKPVSSPASRNIRQREHRRPARSPARALPRAMALPMS